MVPEVRKTFREKFIGDKAFYKLVLSVALPIIVQNAISNFVSMLDNIMVGRLGAEAMSGVAIVNQLYFVYMLCFFGGIGGIGIFTAQYFGKGDAEGIRKTVVVKLYVGVILTALAAVIFIFFGDELITLYLHEDPSNSGDLALTLDYAGQYLEILLLSFPAFCFLQIYVSTLRECSETVLPMKAGIVAVLVNLVFNYILIYGKLGFPALGVRGAAIATVLSRYVEAGIVVIWAHAHKEKNAWVVRLYRDLRLPKETLEYLKKGLPLLANETLWSAGQAVLTQCYSTRGIAVFAGLNIALTLNNVLDIVFFTIGNSIAIIVGQALGAGKPEVAIDRDNKMIAFSVFVSLISAVVMVGVAFFFPDLYNVSPETKSAAIAFTIAFAAVFPKNAFLQSAYFTLRAGGRTVLTFFFDSGSVWLVSVPIAWILSRYTSVSALWIFIWVSIADLTKVALGWYWLKKGIWVNNLVGKEAEGT